MNDLCKLSGGEFGPCQGSMLRLNDNAKMYPTVYCEYHARMVTAWIAETPREPGPIHKFLDKLSAEGWQKFIVTMETVTLDSFIPYVPHLTQRAPDVCLRCAGTGKVTFIPGQIVECGVCGGTGKRR